MQLNRKRSFGRSLVVGLAVALTLLTVGLSSVAATTQQRVKISGTVSASAALPWPILTANFHRVFPNIEVEATPVNAVAQVQQILTQFQAGSPPDFFGTNPGTTNLISVWPMAQAGRLMDLSKRPWVRHLLPSAKNVMSWKGKVYGLPLAIGVVGIIYNRGMFAQYGVKVPTTFAELLTMCQKLKAAGKIPLAMALDPSSGPSLYGWTVAPMVANVFANDPKWNDKRAAKRTTFAGEPRWQRTFQRILDLRDAGCFNPAPQGVAQAQALAMVASGQAAATMATNNSIPVVKGLNPTIDMGIFALPGDTAKENSVPFFASPVLVGAVGTKNPKQVLEFIDFMARPKQAQLYAKITASASSYDAKRGVLPTAWKEVAALFKSGKSTYVPGTEWPNPSMTIGTSGMYAGLIGLFTGQRTIPKLLSDLDYLWDNPTATSAP